MKEMVRATTSVHTYVLWLQLLHDCTKQAQPIRDLAHASTRGQESIPEFMQAHGVRHTTAGVAAE